MEHTQIVVCYDDRERADQLLETLAGYSNIQLQKKRLPLGDYQLNDWLIERKTLANLVVSLCDGRLFSQIYQLSQSSYNTALLIEGSTQDIIQYQISREAILGGAMLYFNQLPDAHLTQPITTRICQNALFSCNSNYGQ